MAEVEEEADLEEVAFKAQIVMMIELMKICKINKAATIVEEEEVEARIRDSLKTIEAVAAIEEEVTEEVMATDTVVNGMMTISMKTFLISEKGNGKSLKSLPPVRVEP